MHYCSVSIAFNTKHKTMPSTPSMLNKRSLIGAILWIHCAVRRECVSAFLAPRHRPRVAINPTTIQFTTRRHPTPAAATRDDGDCNLDDPSAGVACRGRREWSRSMLSSLIASSIGFSVAAGSDPDPAYASTDGGHAIIWKTGRAPIVPGQKPKDKDDVRGTRKDPNFLRSVADCKGKCENTPGPDGLARSSTECLSACQDICCTTYEQCTFAIVPR